MPRRQPTIRLTARDLDLLRWIGQGGIAALDQIARRFWPGARMATARTRLGQLVAAGYLALRWSHTRRPPDRIYSLTRAGRAALPHRQRRQMAVGWPAVAQEYHYLAAQ